MEARLRSLKASFERGAGIQLNQYCRQIRGRDIIDLSDLTDLPHNVRYLFDGTILAPFPREIIYRDCIICFEHDPTFVTNCGHQFHQRCLETWLEYHETCGFCRGVVSFVYEYIINEYNKYRILTVIRKVRE